MGRDMGGSDMSGSEGRRSPWVVGRDVFALAGAWIPSVFSSAVLLPQRVEALVGSAQWPAAYAAISSVGWLAVVVGLTLSGRLQDAGRIGGPRDRSTLPILAMLTLVGGWAITLPDSIGSLAVLWAVAMLPPAAAVTLLAARAAARVARRQESTRVEGVAATASAIGAAPLLAVLVGSVVIRVVPVAGAERSVVIGAVAAMLLLCGARHAASSHGGYIDEVGAPDPLAGGLPAPLAGPVVRGAMRQHARLLGGVALVDTGTVTLTFAIVPLSFLLPRTSVPDPGGYAELIVLAAAVCALVAVWVAPRLPGMRAVPRSLFLGSGLTVAVVLVIGPFAGHVMLAVVALVAGLAIGASNAATFGVFLTDPASRERPATALGLLNAMPSFPAVMVPLVAAPLLRSAPGSALTVVMVAAGVLTAAGALLVGRSGAWARPGATTPFSAVRAPRGGRAARPARGRRPPR